MSVKNITAATKERIVAEPLRSAGLALASGFILSRIPIFSIILVVIRIMLALVRPALLVLGAAKAWDLSQKTQSRPQSVEAHPKKKIVSTGL